MPSFPITEVPTQISQVVTQESLIQNTGLTTVYLANESTVGSGSYDLIVAAKTTVNWPANASLWAATAAGDTGQLSILYGAKGAGVGDITASIVDPVNVQGGAVEVYSAQTVFNAAGFTDIDIAAPPDGVTYYGLHVYFTILSTTSVANVYCDAQISYQGIGNTSFRLRVGQVQVANAIAWMGDPSVNEVSLPLQTQYPVRIRLWASAGVTTVFMRVVATSYALPYPVSPMAGPNQNGSVLSFVGKTIVAPAAGNYIALQSSLNNRRFRLWTDSSGLTGVHLRRIQWTGAGAATEVITAPHLQVNPNLRYAAPPATDTFSVSEFGIPGDGELYQILFNNAFAGTVFINPMEINR